ncbi:threonylcarbamoyl-AMP synthase [Paenalkalicoccus suaedae]|uniref:Threonylcarbamoyl-AMP synthase n=1 Tax=Paenalkalicoccus suaedae TaxID=2592382 RepID=A0A859FJA6_9BACI|nr:L-threonylcarbamoyladenylate synthase [Paenalkalicoccus suaedae]QKS72766.1 threonylcarbamoyl-AMP synthase [Paenalkalicoccus suaedae]
MYQQTTVWNVDKNVDKSAGEGVQEAGRAIQSGEVVAFPTETVYGLGGDATSDTAVARIFEAKGRPSDNPLIVHIAETEDMAKLTNELPKVAEQLMDAFWPGPLAIIVKHNHSLSTIVTAGLDTVAVRLPDHEVAREVIKASGVPVAAPSANRSGRPSPTTAQHVYDDLNGRIAGIVDGGATGVGVESTVIDCTVTPPMILRPGGLSKADIESVIGEVAIDPALTKSDDAPRSPGMKYTHYAPDAPLVLVDGDQAFLEKVVGDAQAEGNRVGVLVPDEYVPNVTVEKVVTLGSISDVAAIAAQLYDGLRSFSTEDVDIIFATVYERDGIGEAVMNRLEKAAGGVVVRR